jgi:hypothetical protein
MNIIMQEEEATPTSSKEKLRALKAAVDGKDKVEAAAVLRSMKPETVVSANFGAPSETQCCQA